MKKASMNKTVETKTLIAANKKALHKLVEKAQKAYDKAVIAFVDAKWNMQNAKDYLKNIKNTLKAAK